MTGTTYIVSYRSGRELVYEDIADPAEALARVWDLKNDGASQLVMHEVIEVVRSL